jgi:hypothetical protein
MQYTLAVTSCGRHDLLHRTLQSYFDCVSNNPVATIILEDGPDPAPTWLQDLKPRMGKLSWINNVERMGQSYSIDRLYNEIKTEYVFHLEDDWEFTESGFLQPSFIILRDNPTVSMVALRTDWNHPLIAAPAIKGYAWMAEPYWGGVWGGTCWNPGLRRLSDYTRFGSYGRHCGYGTHGLGHEQVWSKLHLDAGLRIAVLPSHCHHIGGGRSRAVEPLERRMPRLLIAVPACDNFDYGRWESKDDGTGYGIGIHTSGPNPRIQAVRDTWFKDVEPFASNVEARFFYGEPKHDLLADEVKINVKDDYESLPAKTREICRWALANNYDFVFKCDDDTAVYVDRLYRELLDQRFDYAGYEHCAVCTGGPGYFLSRRAMRAVVDAGSSDHWAEDCWVAKVLGYQNIRSTMLPGHTPGYAAHWIWPDKFDPKVLNPEIVTLHAVQPEMMRTWHKQR